MQQGFNNCDAMSEPPKRCLTILRGHLTSRAERGVALAATLMILAGGGFAVALASGGADSEPAALTYDSVPGEIVPVANDAFLRSLAISSTAVEGNGSVSDTTGLTPDSVDSPAKIAIDDGDPRPYGPTIERVDSNDPDARPTIFPPSVLVPTTVYSTFDGSELTEVWAGGKGSDTTAGKVIRFVGSLTSGDQETPSVIQGTGSITLTRFVPDLIYFTTQSGQAGSYRISTGAVTLYTRQAFNPARDLKLESTHTGSL